MFLFLNINTVRVYYKLVRDVITIINSYSQVYVVNERMNDIIILIKNRFNFSLFYFYSKLKVIFILQKRNTMVEMGTIYETIMECKARIYCFQHFRFTHRIHRTTSESQNTIILYYLNNIHLSFIAVDFKLLILRLKIWDV